MSSTIFMLAKEYNENMKIPKKLQDYDPPIGWMMSEKLDGYRAIYNPELQEFESRQNKLYNSPLWFKQFLPKIYLDGELFAGRGPKGFEKMGVVRKKIPIDNEWMNIQYCVYELLIIVIYL